MALTQTTNQETHIGGVRTVSGTYTNTGGSTGGSIATGLTVVTCMFLQPVTTAVVTSFPVPNATFPQNGGAVTIVTTANEVGCWLAKGF